MKRLLWCVLAVVVVAACASSDTPPKPEGVSWFDHVFGETSVPLNERNVWWDGPKASKVLPFVYVAALPPSCTDTHNSAGCAVLDVLADTCTPYIKVTPDMPHARRVCAELHEGKEGHCGGKYHANTGPATTSCGPRFQRIADLERFLRAEGVNALNLK